MNMQYLPYRMVVDSVFSEGTKAQIEKRRLELTQLNSEIAARQVTNAIPTSDYDVKMTLRARGEPICLFGEDSYARRQRLTMLIVQMGNVEKTESTDIVEDVKQSDFYTVGDDKLKEFRHNLLSYSLKNAAERLCKERNKMDLCENLEESLSDLKEKQKLHSSKLTVALSQVGDVRPLTSVKFSPDSHYIATASWTGQVKIWNLPHCLEAKLTLNTGSRLPIYGVEWFPSFKSNMTSLAAAAAAAVEDEDEGNSNNIRLSHEGHDLGPGLMIATASGDGSISLWGGNGKERGRLQGHERRVSRLAFNSLDGGKFLASTSHDMTWRLWDVETCTELLLQEGHSSPVFSAAWHVDGALLASGDTNGVIQLWDVRVGKPILNLRGHAGGVFALGFNPCKPHELVSGSEDCSVKVWDLRQQKSVHSLLSHKSLVSGICFDSVKTNSGGDSSSLFLVTSSFDKTIKLWKAGEGQNYELDTTLEGSSSRIMCLDAAKDGSGRLGTCSYDRTFKIWSRSDDEAIIAGYWNEETAKHKTAVVEWPTVLSGDSHRYQDDFNGKDVDNESDASGME